MKLIELTPRMEPFCIMYLTKLELPESKEPIKFWGWFIYNNDTFKLAEWHNRKDVISFSFWGYVGKTINFSRQKHFNLYEKCRTAKTKLKNGYTDCTMHEFLNIWPDFQVKLQEHFLAGLMSEKIVDT